MGLEAVGNVKTGPTPKCVFRSCAPGNEKKNPERMSPKPLPRTPIVVGKSPGLVGPNLIVEGRSATFKTVRFSISRKPRSVWLANSNSLYVAD